MSLLRGLATCRDKVSAVGQRQAQTMDSSIRSLPVLARWRSIVPEGRGDVGKEGEEEGKKDRRQPLW